MRCERCKASYEEHYAESYECDWYCKAGVPEDEMNENKYGEWGCNLHYKTIEKRLKINEAAWIKDKEAYVEWFLKEQQNENVEVRGMREDNK